jgi:hypothetical protein
MGAREVGLETERVRELARKECVAAQMALAKLESAVAFEANALRRALVLLSSGESAGAIGTGCGSDLDMAAFGLARRLERLSLLVSMAYEAEGGQ